MNSGTYGGMYPHEADGIPDILPSNMMAHQVMPHMEHSMHQQIPTSSISHHMPSVSMNTPIDHRLSYGGQPPSASAIPLDHRLAMRKSPNQLLQHHDQHHHDQHHHDQHHHDQHQHVLTSPNQRIQDARRDPRFGELPSVGTVRVDGLQSPDKYGQVPRNIYTPLNNEDDRANITNRRPPDLMIINNTMTGPAIIMQKNSNIKANIHPSGSLPRAPVSRRASEPPQLLGAGAYYLRNRSCDDLNPALPPCDSDSDYREEWQRNRLDQEEREAARSISRSRLRRDSFGEVVSRRSPSQDSIGVSRGGRCSPLLDRQQLDEINRGDRYTPAHDTWSVTGPSSRASPTHESPDHQVLRGKGRGSTFRVNIYLIQIGIIYFRTSNNYLKLTDYYNIILLIEASINSLTIMGRTCPNLIMLFAQ